MPVVESASYLTSQDDTQLLPNSQQLYADPFTNNLHFLNGGPGRKFELITTGNLNSITQVRNAGIISYDSVNKKFIERTLTSDSSITIDYANAEGNNPVISVNDNTTIQQINVCSNGTQIATRSTINFINGNNASVSVTDNGIEDRCDITVAVKTFDFFDIVVPWTIITNGSSPVALKGYNSYVSVDPTNETPFVLPTSCEAGVTINVACGAAGGARLVQNNSQSIVFGNLTTTPGDMGYVQIESGGCVWMVCIVKNTTFMVVSAMGGYFNVN